MSTAMQPSMEVEVQRSGSSVVLYCSQLNSCPDPVLFSQPAQSTEFAATGVNTGRGQVHYRDFEGHAVVVRHYRRGGAIRHLSADRYIYSGLNRTRMWREFELLLQLHAEGLPVPVPVAARIEQLSWFQYCGDLATRKIADARTLAEILSSQSLSAEQWGAVGRVVRNFHDRGVFHADLNAGNIMLDGSGQAYLIDFDRGHRVTTSGVEAFVSNLRRLKRSLESFAAKHSGFCYVRADWSALMSGYQGRS